MHERQGIAQYNKNAFQTHCSSTTDCSANSSDVKSSDKPAMIASSPRLVPCKQTARHHQTVLQAAAMWRSAAQMQGRCTAHKEGLSNTLLMSTRLLCRQRQCGGWQHKRKCAAQSKKNAF